MKIETPINNEFTRISIYDSYGDIFTSKIVQNKSIQKTEIPQIIKKYKISNNKVISKIDISGIIIKGLIDQNSINKERRIFSGFGSVAVIDRQGDYLPIHEFKPVMEKLMQRGAPVTDSHSNHVVGKIVDYTYKPTESGELGLYLTAEIYNHYPSDEETWHKIQDGEYTGFSLGGKAGTKTPTCTNIGCYNILGDIEAWEFSIVERPANQLANIDKVNKLAKASDVVNEVISSIIQKERVYIKSPQDAPEGVKVEIGERSGKYYESENIEHFNESQSKLKDDKSIQPEGYKSPEELSLNELWKNADTVSNYQEGTDASYLIGKHYLTWSRNGRAYLHELKMISVKNIKQTSEDPKVKTPIYSDLKTQAPPVNVTINEDGTYRLFNGHRRLVTAKARGKSKIFAEIYHETPFDFSKYNTQKSYTITRKDNSYIIQKPFAGYEDFEQCVAENKDKGNPNAYCGAIKHKVEKRADFTSEDAKRIGDKLNIDWSKIDQNEFLIGLNIELEHGTKFPETNITDDDEIATAKIALAHLNEFPDYYNEGNGLPEMEDRLKGIKKEKVYVDNPQDAPKGVKIEEGKRGGLYYESEGKISSKEPKSEIEESSNLKEIVKQSLKSIPEHLITELRKVHELSKNGYNSKNSNIDAQGNYLPERLQKHQEIMNEFIGKNSISQQKIAILIGGPTAAGKSSLLRDMGIDFSQYININNDDIKAKLPGYNGINAELYHDEARDIANNLRKKAILESRNLIVDGTMRNFDNEIASIKALKDKGYKIKIISIIVDPITTIKRATDRFIKERRFVPLDIIMSQAKNINITQDKYKEYADEYEKYDSTTFPPKRII